MTIRNVLSTAAVLAMTSVSAFAIPISGAYTLAVGQVSADTVDLSMASRINFTGGSQVAANTLSTFTTFGFNPSSVTSCSNCGVINNITGIPAGSATTPFSGQTLFSVNGLTFTLNTLTAVVRSSGVAGSSLEIKGTGIYSAAGYDNTAGTFDLTAQNGSLTIMADSASASGSVNAVSVPEPASLAILGASLAAIGFVRRRKSI